MGTSKYHLLDKVTGRIVLRNVEIKDIANFTNITEESARKVIHKNKLINRRYLILNFREKAMYRVYELQTKELSREEIEEEFGVSAKMIKKHSDKDPIADLYIERVR